MFSHALRALSALLTMLYLLVSAGACAVTPPGNEVNLTQSGIPMEAPEQPEAVSVNILQSVSDISLPLQEVTEEFARSTGRQVSFHIQTVSGEDYRATLRSKLLAGEPVDLFHLLDRDDVQRLSPMLEDLSATMPWVTDAACGLTDAVTLEGAVYGLPYSLEGVGLIANRRLFELAGIQLNGITDFDSMADAFFELRDKIDAGEFADSAPDLVAVTDLAARDSAYLGDAVAEVLLAGSAPSPARAYAAPVLSAPGAEDAEEFIKLFARSSPQRTNWTAFPAVTQTRMVEEGLAAGRVAVILHDTEIYRRVLTANPELEGQLVLLPVYLQNSEQGMVFTGAPAWWGIRAQAGNAAKECAQALLTWLYHSNEGGQVLAERFGVLSPYRDTAASTGVSLHSQLLAAVDAQLAVPRLAPEAPHGWGDVFAQQLVAYFTDSSKEWDDVVNACAADWAERRG